MSDAIPTSKTTMDEKRSMKTNDPMFSTSSLPLLFELNDYRQWMCKIKHSICIEGYVVSTRVPVALLVSFIGEKEIMPQNRKSQNDDKSNDNALIRTARKWSSPKWGSVPFLPCKATREYEDIRADRGSLTDLSPRRKRKHNGNGPTMGICGIEPPVT